MKSSFHLGTYLITPDRNVIQRNGSTIRLEPKVMQVLVHLAEHPGEVVAKEDLMQAVWPDTFVTDDVLKRCVSQLRKALDDDPREPRVIETIAKGGYRLLLRVEPFAVPEEQRDADRMRTSARARLLKWVAWVTLSAIALGGGVFVQRLRRSPGSADEWHVRPLSTLAGWHGRPSFSPDATSVAFHYAPENSGPDIYVQLLGDERALRLTNTRSSVCPTWSPVGPLIAYNRRIEWRPGAHVRGISVMTALGGSQRMLARASADHRLCKISWSQDGRTLVYSHDPPGEASGLFAVSLDGGEPRRLTSAPPATTDSDAAFSPDGTQIVFVRERTIYVSDLYLVPANGGEPKQITFLNAGVWSPNWSSDGHTIVFSLGGYIEGMHATATKDGRRLTSGLYTLLLRDLSFARLPLPQTNIMNPALSNSGDAIAYEKYAFSLSTWRVSLAGDDIKPKKLIAASGDSNSVFSSDGRKIAFVSGREGHMGIWTCDADGANPARLTDVQTGGSPDWSADGRTIVFDDRSTGRSHIYSIDLLDLHRRQLTEGDFDNAVPVFSADGRSLYFGSNRTGRFEVWKLSLSTRQLAQITRDGGLYPQESPDGRFVYYNKVPDGDAMREIWRVPVQGGRDERVITEADQNWRIRSDGIYFAARLPDRRPVLKRYDFGSRQSSVVARLAGPVTIIGRNLSIAPNGREAIYAQFDASSNQIMIAERASSQPKRR